MSEPTQITTKPMFDIDFVKVLTSSAFSAGTVALLMRRESGEQMTFPIDFPDAIPFLSRFNGEHYLPVVAGGAVFLGSIFADLVADKLFDFVSRPERPSNGRVALTEMVTMGGSVLGAFMLLNSGVFGDQQSKMKAFQIAALAAVAEIGAEVITGKLYDSLDYTTDLFENATGIGIPFLP